MRHEGRNPERRARRREILGIFAAVAALAGCGDRGDRVALRSPGDTVLLRSPSGEVYQDSAVSEYRGVNYTLTDAGYQRWTTAQRSLDVLPPDAAVDRTARVRARGVSDADVDRVVAYLERRPAARRAIESSGLSVREYVLSSIALAQASSASDSARARFRDLPQSDIEFVARHRDDIGQIRSRARYSVVDEGEDDQGEDEDGGGGGGPGGGHGHGRGRGHGHGHHGHGDDDDQGQDR